MNEVKSSSRLDTGIQRNDNINQDHDKAEPRDTDARHSPPVVTTPGNLMLPPTGTTSNSKSHNHLGNLNVPRWNVTTSHNAGSSPSFRTT